VAVRGFVTFYYQVRILRIIIDKFRPRLTRGTVTDIKVFDRRPQREELQAQEKIQQVIEIMFVSDSDSDSDS
jgi:hypothetical protein